MLDKHSGPLTEETRAPSQQWRIRHESRNEINDLSKPIQGNKALMLLLSDSQLYRG